MVCVLALRVLSPRECAVTSMPRPNYFADGVPDAADTTGGS